MPDPLSITTGVVALLEVTWNVSIQLKKFHDGVKIIDKTVEALQREVGSFSQVLESMRNTFADITAEFGTGYVASHWRDLAKAMEDTKGVLEQFSTEIQKIDRPTKLPMVDPMRQLRLNLSEERIAGFRGHLQSHRGVLQISLQAIMFANQVACHKSTEFSLSDLSKDIRQMDRNLNHKIGVLQSMVLSQQDEIKVLAMSNLRACVRSAATIVSSASTAIPSLKAVQTPCTVPGSELEDCLPKDEKIALSRWWESNTIYDFDEPAALPTPHSIADLTPLCDGGHCSDSDSDFENEVVDDLFAQSRVELEVGDVGRAKSLLLSCLSRIPDTRHGRHLIKRLDVMDALVQLHTEQQEWTLAQKILTEKMAITERQYGKTDPHFLQDVISLAKISQSKGDIVEAKLHARRAWKGYKKAHDDRGRMQRRCLDLLIELCQPGHDDDDRVAYEVLLERLDSSTTVCPDSTREASAAAEPEALNKTAGYFNLPHGQLCAVAISRDKDEGSEKATTPRIHVLDTESCSDDEGTPSATPVSERRTSTNSSIGTARPQLVRMPFLFRVDSPATFSNLETRSSSSRSSDQLSNTTTLTVPPAVSAGTYTESHGDQRTKANRGRAASDESGRANVKLSEDESSSRCLPEMDVEETKNTSTPTRKRMSFRKMFGTSPIRSVK